MKNTEKTIKNMYTISGLYLLFGLIIGVATHEIEYYRGFSGTTALKNVHPHAIALGTLLFLLLPLFIKVFDINSSKFFNKFLIIYNVGLIGSLFFMSFRGMVQIFEISISSFLDHMIGGLAGISHVILTIGLFFLYKTLQSSVKGEKLIK